MAPEHLIEKMLLVSFVSNLSTTGDFTLGQMPPLTTEWSKMAGAITMPFRGEPSLPLLANGDAGEEEEDEDPDAPVPEKFREMHRLAFVVGQIDHDAAVLPRGAFVVDASHRVGRNKSYEVLAAIFFCAYGIPSCAPIF